jgi:hypothetical protein
MGHWARLSLPSSPISRLKALSNTTTCRECPWKAAPMLDAGCASPGSRTRTATSSIWAILAAVTLFHGGSRPAGRYRTRKGFGAGSVSRPRAQLYGRTGRDGSRHACRRAWRQCRCKSHQAVAAGRLSREVRSCLGRRIAREVGGEATRRGVRSADYASGGPALRIPSMIVSRAAA